VARNVFSALVLLLALAGARPASAQDRPDAPTPAALRGLPERLAPRAGSHVELPSDARDAIDRGLRYLARNQLRSGAWAAGEYQLPVSALCGTALLAGGSTPRSGPYAANVRRCAEYLLRNQLRSGLFLQDGGYVDDRPMYGHGFALLFLAECYGMAGDFSTEKKLARSIERAIALVGQAQSRDGGWYYTAKGDDDEGSVTITQIQGLRAARNAGFQVDRRVIDRAIEYIRRSQDPDGGVRYTVRYGRSSLALTSAGLSVLFGAGDYSSENVARALGYVRRNMETGPDTAHFHYTHFYLSQALHQCGGADWESYFPWIRAELVRSRRSDGSWPSMYGEAYGTALSLLILELPLRYLPIYER
jgi:hypothetical protein